MPPVSALLALAVALLGAIALEALPAGSSNRPPARPAASPRFAAPAPRIDRTDAEARTLLARPLFARDRRPVPEAPAAAGPAAPDALPRLSGIVIATAGRRALFQDGDRTVIRGEGDRIGRFKVVAIGPERVKVEGPAGAVDVRVTFDGDRVIPPPAPVAPPPPPQSLVEQLNPQGPPAVPLPKPPKLETLMSRLPRK